MPPAFPGRLRRLGTLVAFLLLGLLPGRAGPAAAAPARRPPNIVFLLADDLGLGDIGPYGQRKIRTPHLDRFAADGLRFTQHYSGNAVCAPSRCVLMTGRHPGHALVRDNREAQPEGQWPLPDGTVTLARLLQSAGYATGAFGKWGLGGPGTSGDPRNQGFDRFFGYNCQRLAHNYYPTNLWDNDRRVPLDNPAFSPHQRLPTNANPRDATAYRSYAGREFAPDRITDEALRFIRDHRDHPFFLFYPTTVPHLALQVPEDSLAEYEGRFEETPYLGEKYYLPHPKPRAAYAAMVSRLDREVGRIVAQVGDLGLDGDTIFIFASDNGPLYDRIGGTDSDFFNSAAGLRGRKGALYEGGVRVPCLVRWTGHIRAGSVSSRVTGFEDWLPTLLELAGRRDLVPGDLDGISFVPVLRGRSMPERPFLYREFPAYGGWQSVRVGDWKLVQDRLNLPASAAITTPSRPELYNLRRDPAETTNLAGDHPARVRRLQALLRREHGVSPDFPFPALDREAPGR